MFRRLVFSLVVLSVIISPWLVPVVASASDPPLYISAVQITGGTGRTKDDFVEIFNPGDTAVSLSGYSLIKRTATSQTNASLVSFPSTATIAPRSFILWVNSEFTAVSTPPDFTSTGFISDDNGVALLRGGVVVDSVAWGTTNNGLRGSGLANPTANQSVVRSDLYAVDSSYALAASQPRNSSVVDPGPVIPPPPPALVDNAACPAPASVTVAPSGQLIVSLSLQNNGATTWSADYTFTAITTPPGLLWDVTGVALAQAVPPGQSVSITVMGLAPETIGSYSATWQMRNQAAAFGDLCTIQFVVSEPAPPGPTPPPVVPPVVPPITPPVGYSRQLRLTEVLPNPVGSDPGHEAVEIYNAGSTAVSLTNWRLSDGAIEDGPASNSYQLTTQRVEAGQYLGITIPSGRFSMNNSTGDTVTLYDPNEYAVDSISYPGPAPEGKSYQVADQIWLWAPPSLGIENTSTQNPTAVDAPPLPPLEISEIGQTLKEGAVTWFLELHNTVNQAVSISGVSLFVSNGGDEPVRLLVPSQTINSHAYTAITMSDEDVIAALTTGASLSLQTSTSAIIDVVHLAQLPTTTVSWGKTNSGKWQLGRPTPGSQNYFVIPPPIIKLSEIYPYPASGEEEFVELYNSGDEPVSLSTLTLGVDKSESALPTGQIFPGEFYLVSGDDLPKALPNKVGLVWLKDRFGSVIDQISYTKAPKGQSLVRTGAKNLIWTKDITSGEAYGRVLGVATDTEVIVAPEPAPETSATKSTATIKTSAKTSTSSSQATLQKKVLALESQLAQAAAALDQKSTTTQLAMADGGQSSEVSSQSEAMTPTPKNNTPSKAASRWWVWAILAGIVFVCAVITYIIARSETE